MHSSILTMITLLIFTLSAGQALSHSLWVNAHESFTHPPGHVLISLGWGHEIPMDDFLMSDTGAVTIERYDLLGPDGSISPLAVPMVKKETTTTSKTGMTIVPGDLGLRKIALTDTTIPGTYAVVAESLATYFSGYFDAKGKYRMTYKAMDEIQDARSFDFSVRYKAVAKSYVGVREWTDPKPAGHDLEIMPITDLGKVRAKDMVEFKVTLKGRPVTSDTQGIHYVHMTSNTFGGPDKYMLSAYLQDGRARLRVPTAGQWMASVLVKKEVKPDNELKDLVKKCRSVFYGSTLTFHAKP